MINKNTFFLGLLLLVPVIINAGDSGNKQLLAIANKTLTIADCIGNAANVGMIVSTLNRNADKFLPKNFINFKKTPPISLKTSETILALTTPIAAILTSKMQIKHNTPIAAQILYRGGQAITSFNSFVLGAWAIKTAYNGGLISKATFGTAGILLCGAGTIAAGKAVLSEVKKQQIYTRFGGKI